MPEETITEYGIQLPDGTQRWGDYTRGTLRHDAADIARDRRAYNEWLQDLRRVAESAGLNPDWFIGEHKLIARDRVTTVSAPYDVTVPGRPTAEDDEVAS